MLKKELLGFLFFKVRKTSVGEWHLFKNGNWRFPPGKFKRNFYFK